MKGLFSFDSFSFDDIERAKRESGIDLPKAMLDQAEWQSRRELARRALPGTWIFLAAIGIGVSSAFANGATGYAASATVAALVGTLARLVGIVRFSRGPRAIRPIDYQLFFIAGVFLPLVWAIIGGVAFYTQPADWSRAGVLAFTAAMGASAIYVWGIWRTLARTFTVVLLGPLLLAAGLSGGVFGWLVVLGCSVFAIYMRFEANAWNRLHWQSHLSVLQLERQADELAEAKNVAEAASTAKSEFLTVVSHELRTPMNAILGFAQLLRIEAGHHKAVDQGCGEIIQSGEHLMSLIEQILDLARIERGSLELRITTIDPVEISRQVVDIFRTTLAPEVTLEFRHAPGLENFQCDALRLRQILLNLVGNAVKFTPHGTITVELTRSGESDLTIRVHDTGVGMAADVIAGIFEPFAQADSSAARNYGGIGLGLPITRQLVVALGGTIDVESTLGIGSVFTVQLPDAQPTQSSLDDASAAALTPD